MLFVVLFPGGAFCWIQVSWSSDLTRRTVGTQGLNLSLCLSCLFVYSFGGVFWLVESYVFFHTTNATRIWYHDVS
jgi:hypothetical protein